jgi:hypothetical protein
MTTAYAPIESQASPPGHPRLPILFHGTGSARGSEVDQLRKVAQQYFNERCTFRGHSAESTKITRKVIELVRSGDNLLVFADENVSRPYVHIALDPVFSVRARYKDIGELQPRKFTFDE